MGGLIGFALGYYLGLKERPERIAELQQAFGDILASREVQALLSSAQLALSGLVARASEAREGGGADLAQAWQTITASEEFKAFVAGGTALFEDIARRGFETAASARGEERFDG